MENAHIFAQSEIDERRLHLYLVVFPERSPLQRKQVHQGLFTCSRSCSVVCPSQEPVLHCDLLSDLNLRGKSGLCGCCFIYVLSKQSHTLVGQDSHEGLCFVGLNPKTVIQTVCSTEGLREINLRLGAENK